MTCAKQTTKATIITRSGERFIGTNWCRNPQAACPREGLPTGIGYDKCINVCDQTAHAEVNACIAAGEKAVGATLYLEGHTYACGNCTRTMNEYGIERFIIGKPTD